MPSAGSLGGGRWGPGGYDPGVSKNSTDQVPPNPTSGPGLDKPETPISSAIGMVDRDRRSSGLSFNDNVQVSYYRNNNNYSNSSSSSSSSRNPHPSQSLTMLGIGGRMVQSKTLNRGGIMGLSQSQKRGAADATSSSLGFRGSSHLQEMPSVLRRWVCGTVDGTVELFETVLGCYVQYVCIIF